MDFNGPGLSLFQGSNLAGFDNNTQREEEEEAIEEQRRRDIELKNILENAFDDVSFDNEDCSGLNISFNDQNSNCHGKSPNSCNDIGVNKTHSSILDASKHDKNANEYNTPVRHPRNVRTKALDFNHHFEQDNYSEQYRIKQQNGSLHDVVDASGGGDAMSMHFNHCNNSNPIGEHKSSEDPISSDAEKSLLNKLYQNADYNSLEQLQILYDVRVREVHRLTELVDTMKNKYEYEKSELKRQLAISSAEQERHKISYGELQNLLVSTKEENDNLKESIEYLRKGVRELEESKEELAAQLQTAKATVNDLERKLLAVEKGRKDVTAAMQYEATIQELKEKHSLSMGSVLKDLDACKINLDNRTRENDELKYKLTQLGQLNDENLAKKSEIIQRLSKQIEETQEQCEKLMRNSLSEDNVKLQMEVKILKDENGNLTSKIENLEKALASQETELKQYECLSNLSAFDSRNSADAGADKESSEYSEVNRKLREELFRALNSQKARRQEMQSLQTLIKKKDEQIRCMAEKERMFLAEAAKFRDDIGKHMGELKKYEHLTAVRDSENKKLHELLEDAKKELESSAMVASKRCSDLERQNKSLQEELTILKGSMEQEKLEAVSKYNEEYLKFHNDGLKKLRQEVEESFKLELLGKDIEIENYKKEVEEVKNLYVEVYNEKEHLLNQIEKEKSTGGRAGVDVDEVKRLQKELERSRERILDLDLTLRQQYQQEVEKLNGNIKHLRLEAEKLKKERDHELSQRDKLITENELLKGEVEQLTAEKNVNFLNCETLKKETDQLKRDVGALRKSSDEQTARSAEEHRRQLQDLRTKYEITVQKLNKEIELMLTKSVAADSKQTSPLKTFGRSVATQRSPVATHSISTSPLHRWRTHESSTSPVRELRSPPATATHRHAGVLADPEPKNLSKREVIRMMEKLGAEHEEELHLVENKYKMELIKLDKRWQSEMESIKRNVRLEMMNLHAEELDALNEKHRTEMENRIDQEKKEAVVALITEWACEVQNLKQSQAEAQAETERMRAKYKTAKNLALRYKAYFASKAEHMKEEWKKVELGYEKALKELERNVHMLVDVREDEVKAKVESITNLYEQKINKMKCKLEKYEDLLKSEAKSEGKAEGKASGRNSAGEEKKPGDGGSASNAAADKLVPPDSYLCRRSKRHPTASSSSARIRSPRNNDEENFRRGKHLKKLLNDAHFPERESTDEDTGKGRKGAPKDGT